MVWRVAPDGQLEPLASTHADVRQRDLVAQAAREAAATPRSPGLNYVATQGQSLLYPEFHPAVLEMLSETQQRRARHLGVRSVTSVPLTSGGKTVGAMTWAAVSRNYSADDMTLAEAVADRLAAALENARLYAVAQQAIQARDEFMVMAAHELRTPLTALELFVHAAQSGAVPQGNGDENARRVVRQVKRLSSLVERLWDAANIRAAGVALAPESCDLASIVRERADAALSRARPGQSIAVRTPPSLRGRWDRTRVSQLLDELLQNAVKFGEGKPIEVALDRHGIQALLMVRDHGVGIPSERLEFVFAPFERGPRGDPLGGLGLGLHVAKAIVEAHGGAIEAASAPGVGTTMRVKLPIEVESVRVVVNQAP